MQFHVFDTVAEVLDGLATYFIEAAGQSVSAKGRFAVALSGGSSPKALYQLLASAAYKDTIDWRKVFFFFGDERYVPETDPASNYRMADEVLFKPLGIAAEQVFKVRTQFSPAEAAADYDKQITAFFGIDKPVFDLVLLGLGDNSHTASLFPYTPVLFDKTAGVKEVFLKDQHVFRITFTAPLINQADRIAFLVYGESKAEAVYSVLHGDEDIELYPAQLIRPEATEPDWFLDKGAAARLPL